MLRGRFITENLFADSHLELLTESTSEGKKFYLEGPCVMTNRVNRNGRNYDFEKVGVPMVEAYNRDWIGERRAIGECEHPDYPFPKIKEAAVIIQQPLKWEKYDAVGKLEVLDNPNGQIIVSLIKGNYNLGVSTRGLGDATTRDRVEHINEGFMLTAVDVVDKPSGQTCYVKAIRESVMWEQTNEGVWVPQGVNGKVVDEILEANRQTEEFARRFKKALENLG